MQKANISYPVIRTGKVSFSENFAKVPNEWTLIQETEDLQKSYNECQCGNLIINNDSFVLHAVKDQIQWTKFGLCFFAVNLVFSWET